ncbi:MAG: polyprenyl synthetase family protein [Caldilineaceae bacterium]
MDRYRMMFDYLLALPAIQAWPEAQALLTRIGERKPYYWQLPLMACQAVGGDEQIAIPGMAATACLHTAILLIDDMLDADPRGEYQRLGAPATANLASALQAAGLEAITQSEAKAEIKLPVLVRLNQMMLATSLGQGWDVQNPQDEASYWRVIATKSAPFFGTALYIGALLGGAGETRSAQLYQFGALYGEMIQLHDDLGDVMEQPANPDWTMGRSPLPILFAETVQHPARQRFLALRQTIAAPFALEEAQTILIHCGAISYTVDQLLRRARQAQTILAQLALAHQAPMGELLNSVVTPLAQLLTTAGVSQPEAVLMSLPFPQFASPQLDPV